ncbi:MAG: hypothetical protein KF745_06140 [Phycisphaeraceae bacterium]|nr:hypothetical protein [Phycisphaeraceae bacterium]
MLHPLVSGVRLLAAMTCLALSLPGCTPGSTRLDIESSDRGRVLAPEFVTGVYAETDNNTATMYLSDLPLETLTSANTQVGSLTGTIVHIHMFLVPEAGRTPIDRNACNISIQAVVLSQGRIGHYGGGGFLLPAGEPGGSKFGGSLLNATLVLLQSNPGFADRLGVATVSGAVSAARDPGATNIVAQRFDSIVSALPIKHREQSEDDPPIDAP